MIKHIIIKSVGNKDISLVISCIYSPVVVELFGSKNKNTVIAKFIIFDNCESCKGFTQTYTIGNDTTVISFNLINSTNNTITLEFI